MLKYRLFVKALKVEDMEQIIEASRKRREEEKKKKKRWTVIARGAAGRKKKKEVDMRGRFRTAGCP